MYDVVFLFEYPHATGETVIVETMNVSEIVQAYRPKTYKKKMHVSASEIKNTLLETVPDIEWCGWMDDGDDVSSEILAHEKFNVFNLHLIPTKRIHTHE